MLCYILYCSLALHRPIQHINSYQLYVSILEPSKSKSFKNHIQNPMIKSTILTQHRVPPPATAHHRTHSPGSSTAPGLISHFCVAPYLYLCTYAPASASQPPNHPCSTTPITIPSRSAPVPTAEPTQCNPYPPQPRYPSHRHDCSSSPRSGTRAPTAEPDTAPDTFSSMN